MNRVTKTVVIVGISLAGLAGVGIGAAELASATASASIGPVAAHSVSAEAATTPPPSGHNCPNMGGANHGSATT